MSDNCNKKIKNGKKYYYSDYDCPENNSDADLLIPNEPVDKRNFVIYDLLKLDFIFSRRNLRFKRIMRIIIPSFAFFLIISLTVCLGIFICNLENLGITGDGSMIASIVGSLVTYATSVIMIFKIIIEYIFNKEEDKERTTLISKILQFDEKSKDDKAPSSPTDEEITGIIKEAQQQLGGK